MGRFFDLRGYYPSTGGSGVPALAASFTAANSEHMTVAIDTTLGGNATSFWRAFRVRFDAIASIRRLLFCRPGTTGWGVHVTAGGVFTLEAYDNVAGLRSITDATASTDTWYSVYVEYNGTLLRLIIDDGTPASSASFTIGPATSGTMFVGSLSATVHEIDGDISAISGGNTLPTAAEITELALGKKYASLSAGLQAKTLFAWDMDEYSDGTGAVTRADSVGSRDLTDVNTVPSGAV